MRACNRRTCTWDSTSLFKGMSWDRLRAIMGMAVAMSVLHDGRAVSFSRGLQTRHKDPFPPLPLEPTPGPACLGNRGVGESMADVPRRSVPCRYCAACRADRRDRPDTGS